MNERLHICSDRILPRDLMRFRPTIIGEDMIARAISPIGKTWMNGSVLRVKFMGGKTEEQNKVKEQADWWSSVANIKFDFVEDPGAECRITFDENDGAWSYIGTDCSHIPLNSPTMNLGFLDGGTPAHELGHAIGLAHEHANPASGIQWNEAVVLREAARSPNFWSEEVARHNILFKYSADQINGTRFDPESIMLYWFPPEWTLNGISTKQNDVLSALDKSFIGGSKMYPKSEPTHEDALELVVNAAPAQESIGQAGEEDAFFFMVDSGGQYVIETGGPLDSILNLYGPDSHTALIATDDDSGVGLASRIQRGLIAGKYYAQVRHYNRLKGVGNYSISVKKV